MAPCMQPKMAHSSIAKACEVWASEIGLSGGGWNMTHIRNKFLDY
jgi:hypothetical protein